MSGKTAAAIPTDCKATRFRLLAQIMGVVDVFDALTTPRPYKKALPVDQANSMLLDEVERGWRERDLVETFIRLDQRGL